MDASSLFIAVVQGLIQSWYIWLIVFVLFVMRTPLVKGFFGELLVNKAIDFQLDKNKYHTLKNVTLKTTDGTTQIDHIVVSEFGIFVIETKNMKGWIFGGEHQKMWTQKIYKHASKFQNPLHQNYKHIKVIASTLNIEEEKIFSVVVFAGDGTFKTKMPNNVVHGNEFIKYILSKQSRIFSYEEVKSMIEVLKGERFPNTLQTHRNHINHLKSSREPIKQESNICPRCHSVLVLRRVKKGDRAGEQFYGCSNFPQCRFTKVK